MEASPQTVEGKAVWAVLRAAPVWCGGGMTPMRLDRAAVAERLGGLVEAWVLHALLDPYEIAYLAGHAARQATTAHKPGARKLH